MSVLPLAQFLQHFDAPEPVMEEPEAEIVAAFDIEPEPALPSLEEQLEVSRSAGLEEGRAAAASPDRASITPRSLQSSEDSGSKATTFFCAVIASASWPICM